MMQFVNSFICAQNKQRSELVLKLYQNQPYADENGRVVGDQMEPVIDLVFTPDVARDMATSLLGLLDGELDDPEGPDFEIIEDDEVTNFLNYDGK